MKATLFIGLLLFAGCGKCETVTAIKVIRVTNDSPAADDQKCWINAGYSEVTWSDGSVGCEPDADAPKVGEQRTYCGY